MKAMSTMKRSVSGSKDQKATAEQPLKGAVFLVNDVESMR